MTKNAGVVSRIHTFNGGTVPFSQSLFAGRAGQLLFCLNDPELEAGGTATLSTEETDTVVGQVEVRPEEGSSTRLYQTEITLDHPGRYRLRLQDGAGGAHEATLSVLDALSDPADNPFSESDGKKYSKISKVYYRILRHFTQPGHKILEAGSSTGHFSRTMALAGYEQISLLDVRPKPIEQARQQFAKSGVAAQFYVGDFLEHQQSYDFVWNTGLICSGFNDATKEKFIRKAAECSPKLLVICGDNVRKYPELHDHRVRSARGDLPRGGDASLPVGVGAAVTYPGVNVPEIFARHFSTVYTGMISQQEGFAGSERFWTYGENVA